MRSQDRPRSPDSVIGLLAARQHGVVARRQLLRLGIGPDAIARRLANGRLCRIHGGVYAAGHPNLSDEGRWLAGVLAFGHGTLLSHRAAGALWALEPAWRELVEVSAARSVVGRRGIVVHRPRRMDGEDRTVLLGVPVTSVSRTLVDLADVVRPRVCASSWRGRRSSGSTRRPSPSRVVGVTAGCGGRCSRTPRT